MRGPRGEHDVPGASQLGLVYFLLLSNIHHFLDLMAYVEGVIKIQPCGVTKREATTSFAGGPSCTTLSVQHCYGKL